MVIGEGGWLLSVGCVRPCAVAHQVGVRVQLNCIVGPGAGHLLEKGC